MEAADSQGPILALEFCTNTAFSCTTNVAQDHTIDVKSDFAHGAVACFFVAHNEQKI